jgi:hypothetical protein
MRLALLSWQKGYYQRMVLDTTMLIIAIRQLIKGELFNWWRMWKVSAELGRIDVFPPVTLKMQKEARFFTIALFSLALLSVAAALFHRLA